jgi:hypothetical protein
MQPQLVVGDGTCLQEARVRPLMTNRLAPVGSTLVFASCGGGVSGSLDELSPDGLMSLVTPAADPAASAYLSHSGWPELRVVALIGIVRPRLLMRCWR